MQNSKSGNYEIYREATPALPAGGWQAGVPKFYILIFAF